MKEIHVIPVDEKYPDCMFVEDPVFVCEDTAFLPILGVCVCTCVCVYVCVCVHMHAYVCLLMCVLCRARDQKGRECGHEEDDGDTGAEDS